MTGTMQAAVYHGPQDVRIEQVLVPAPRDGEVLLAVRRNGLCGTDATEWAKGPVLVPLHRPHPASGHVGPMILGHEFVGEVVDGSPGLPAGTLVASGAGVWCGQCDRCAEGRTNVCRNYYTLGLNAPGGLAEYVAAPAATLRPIPPGVSVDAAGMAQPLAVGLHAARRAGVRDGDSVVIIGAGAIGTFVLAGLIHLYRADLTVIDLPGKKLERAARLGAAHTVSARSDVVAAVLERTGGRGADVVIEASGASGQFENALRMVSGGGRVLAVGLPKDKPAIDLAAVALREITVESTVAHVCDADLVPALDILAEGHLETALLESVIPLPDVVARGLEPLASGSAEGKILVAPTGR
ncbi:(R,R)-butanediol dehydrogenase/meso-butanediol dehydrogenase/diacetyl reductase [Amycolatopsis echigonensis]|uniref:(R,R)-butanediol dehydrogenase/meso-butanediol dehydrogenase/diacetyl reductase n=1 Tax=Amycolatopsis echigonensis TaxID=2576905 RepID=A0A2N3WUY2_9PSEU|nr:alcohol dehydrogenase catalytic domain-containing protein [Amycolatopsis niigatensis]PKV97663.1 (R,R)-butanediol dehydrogenase/meso-butanediol dehydrogenase/diacetyl reductase [Amycolatopsis niigatensis]